jgi:gamma-glutamylcyclotransferase (GGCT)/AIG2-like uncharacterized protein YtfP
MRRCGCRLQNGEVDASHRLVTYGSLAPGRPNHHHVADLGGRWFHGQVRGRLVEVGWGAALGFPALILDPDGPVIDVQVLESEALCGQWERLDEFEGPGYERVVTVIQTASGGVEGCIYVSAVADQG